MKKILIFVVLFALLMPFNVYAEEQKDYIIDDADLLTNSEEQELEEIFARMGAELEYDIVVYTVDSIGSSTAHLYAEKFFDGNGYGRGEDADGAILLVSIEDRDWGVFGTDMSDSDAGTIGENIVSYLSDGDYFLAFKSFAEEVEDYKSFPLFTNLVIALVVAFIAALITVSVMKGKLKTVRNVDHARDYVRKDGLKLTHSRDLYLYSTVNRVARPKNTSSGGTSRGGTSRGGGASGKF